MKLLARARAHTYTHTHTHTTPLTLTHNTILVQHTHTHAHTHTRTHTHTHTHPHRFRSLFTEKPPNLPDLEAIVGSDLEKAKSMQHGGGERETVREGEGGGGSEG